MPLNQQGLVNYGGNIDKQLEKKITQLFSMLDRKIGEFSRARGLFPAQVKLLQPVHCCVLVGDDQVFVVLAVHDVGGVSIQQFLDWSGKSMNLPTAILLVERDLAFRNAFGLQFMRSVLDFEDDRKEMEMARIAEGYVNDEIANLERLNRIVKINPIFQGREFLINNQMVFGALPFRRAVQYDLYGSYKAFY